MSFGGEKNLEPNLTHQPVKTQHEVVDWFPQVGKSNACP